MSIEMPDFSGLRKSERDFFGQYVIGERQKWRDHIRDQADVIQFIVESIGDTPESNSMSRKKAAASLRIIRTSIAVRINPGDANDNDLLAELDKLIDKCKCEKICFDEFINGSRAVIDKISWLLKHDWNRVKHEAQPIWHFWKSDEKVDRRNREVTKSSVVCNAIERLITLTVVLVIVVAVFAGLNWEWQLLSPKGACDQSSVAAALNTQRPK